MGSTEDGAPTLKAGAGESVAKQVPGGSDVERSRVATGGWVGNGHGRQFVEAVVRHTQLAEGMGQAELGPQPQDPVQHAGIAASDPVATQPAGRFSLRSWRG